MCAKNNSDDALLSNAATFQAKKQLFFGLYFYVWILTILC